MLGMKFWKNPLFCWKNILLRILLFIMTFICLRSCRLGVQTWCDICFAWALRIIKSLSKQNRSHASSFNMWKFTRSIFWENFNLQWIYGRIFHFHDLTQLSFQNYTYNFECERNILMYLWDSKREKCTNTNIVWM